MDGCKPLLLGGLLGGLREKGLVTYPSRPPLLANPSPLLAFLEEYPDLFKVEVLPRLGPLARARLAGTGRVMREAVYPLVILPFDPPQGLELGPVRPVEVGPRQISNSDWLRTSTGAAAAAPAAFECTIIQMR